MKKGNEKILLKTACKKPNWRYAERQPFRVVVIVVVVEANATTVDDNWICCK